MFINWSPIYSVSNSALDAQHKQIIKLMNELHSSVSNNASEQIIQKAIVRTRIILETHLRYEETLMKYSSFSECEIHRQIHRTLLTRTAELFDRSKNKTISITEILGFLKKWWLRHIILDDMKYIESVAKLDL